MRPSKALIEEGFYKFKKRAGAELCWVRGCSKWRAPDRCMCEMHKKRRWRTLNQAAAGYGRLRDHAKERNIEFDITPAYWRGLTDAFCFYKSDSCENLTIDRVNPTKG